ncbi:MAG: LysM domain-containing protein [Candidatus Eisenbacteria bacterium]
MRALLSLSRTTFALAAIVGFASCAGGPLPAVKDPAKGEFYTADEMLRLRGPQADQYCQYMNNSYALYRGEATKYKAMSDSLGVAAESLRTASIDLSAKMVKLQQEVRELRLKEKALNSYVVKPGDTLKSIAQSALGDTGRWQEIYDLNKAMLGDDKTPLKAGTRLNLPKGAKGAGSK